MLSKKVRVNCVINKYSIKQNINFLIRYFGQNNLFIMKSISYLKLLLYALKLLQKKIECFTSKLILKMFISDGHIDDNFFERKICVIAGTRTTDLQFSLLAP